ncbi:hypothetical protein LTR95_019434, partial [Oleoguttula sp. CCFEE 5521]
TLHPVSRRSLMHLRKQPPPRDQCYIPRRGRPRRQNPRRHPSVRVLGAKRFARMQQVASSLCLTLLLTALRLWSSASLSRRLKHLQPCNLHPSRKISEHGVVMPMICSHGDLLDGAKRTGGWRQAAMAMLR